MKKEFLKEYQSVRIDLIQLYNEDICTASNPDMGEGWVENENELPVTPFA